MAILQLSEEFNQKWLFLKEKFVMPYICDPRRHLEQHQRKSDTYLHEAHNTIEDVIGDHETHAMELVQELFNRLLQCISEYLSGTILPSLRAVRGTNNFLAEVIASWEEHNIRVDLLSQYLFPRLQDALFRKGSSPDCLRTCLCRCYIHSVYKHLSALVIDDSASRILEKARDKQYSETVIMVANMISEICCADSEVWSIEWEQGLLKFAEKVLQEVSLTGDTDTELWRMLAHYWWFLSECIGFYCIPWISPNTVSRLVEASGAVISKLIEAERSQLLVALKYYRFEELEAVMNWTDHVFVVAETVCSILKAEVHNSWADISKIYKEVYSEDPEQNECSGTCERKLQSTGCDCKLVMGQNLLTAFLVLWWKFKKASHKLFSRHAYLETQVKQEFRELLKTETGRCLTPEVMADYIIFLMSNVEFPLQQTRFVTVFEVADVLGNKDDFLRNLKGKLAPLLVSNSSPVNHVYRKLVSKLDGPSSSLEDFEVVEMVRETERWDEHNKDFAMWLKNKQKPCEESPATDAKSLARNWACDTNLRVLTARSASWPTEQDVKIRIPGVVSNCLSLFESYFAEKYTDRKLTWEVLHSRAIVTTCMFTTEGREQTKLSLSLLQFCALNLFQESDELCFGNVLEELLPLQCDEDVIQTSEMFIVATIRSMTTAQVPLLLTTGDSALQKSDVLKLNLDFRSCEELLVVPPVDAFISA